MLPWAIQSKAILPGEVRCVFHRDEQDAHAQRQNGIAGFPDYPAANRCSSKPTTADPEPTASPKSADDRGCAASAWGWLHDPAFAAGPAKVVSLVPKTLVVVSIPPKYDDPTRRARPGCEKHGRTGVPRAKHHENRSRLGMKRNQARAARVIGFKSDLECRARWPPAQACET